MVQPLTLALPKCVHLPYLRDISLMTDIYGLLCLIMSTPLGVDILFLLFPPSAVRTLGFRSFEGKVVRSARIPSEGGRRHSGSNP